MNLFARSQFAGICVDGPGVLVRRVAGTAEVGRQLLPASKLAPHTTQLTASLSHLAAQLGQKPTLLLIAISLCSIEGLLMAASRL